MQRVARRWRVGVLCLFFLVITALPVGAAGPYDGIYFADESCIDDVIGPFENTYAISITENSNFGTYWGTTFNVVLFGLNTWFEDWYVGLGTRNGSTVQGQSFWPDGTQFETWTLTMSSPTSFTTTSQYDEGTCSMSGTKVF